jgi:hypothetical protein
MELAEIENKIQYQLVFRFRFDATPLASPKFWNPINLWHAVKEEGMPTIYSMTDMMFWGSRNVTKVAANIWSAIPTFFAVQRADEHPFNIEAMLNTMMKLPKAARDMNTWRFYNKPGQLPFLRLVGRENNQSTLQDIISSRINIIN